MAHASQSTEPMAETEWRGREYYLCPILDALEAAVTPRQRGKQNSILFESNLAQLESFFAMVSFELVLTSLGLSANVMSDRMTYFWALSCASMGRAKFVDI